MSASKAQQQATNRYNDKPYDNLTIRLPKGYRKILKEHAEWKGKSLNQYVVDCIKKDMGMFWHL